MSYSTIFYPVGITWQQNGTTEYIPKDFEDEVAVFLSRELWGYNTEAEHTFEKVCYMAGWYSVGYYNFLRALVNTSKAYPNLTFDVEGRGEDWDDWFLARVHNGKYGIGMAQLPPIESIPLCYDEGEL